MKNTKNKKTRVIVLVIAVVIVAMIAGAVIYLNSYYRSVDVEIYMTSSDTVTVSQLDGGSIFFDGPGTDQAFIFYPGAMVEESAYSPVMFRLAETGIDCFIIKMPAHLAIFGSDKADRILNEYNYDTWYLGGHSLGGAMACAYLAKGNNANKFSAAILFAAYTTKDLSGTGLNVLSLYGSNDKVLNMDNFIKGASLMPARYTVNMIPGGNHAQFGSYGFQKGDGEATISETEQWDITVDRILTFLENCK